MIQLAVMVTFSFIHYAENLGTRPLGQRVRESLLPMIEPGPNIRVNLKKLNICLYLPLAITTDQAKRLESSVEI